ncbi:hypothetical protein HRR83_006360 [Exophiala dermatitidis]|uniref:R3H-associated N-terminal domain-containing protein n=2 Tax=Exophiala dermatitidis TaxID=5970 RepID=H6CA35_EXODN|nr:uncharacterized protein HMPREF1120_07974 [Exophiala dermatitidis NIH/UT8656]KAJ4507374.1 hypothetical protein HRR75_006723 [Exophiala dermatitidis]EHY59999.1 hypothetical protein HMPREF1120_07974 [Exophiala dermatitidis NIH/UT8656]KAJ4509364.1 hypothetical protein HRR73_007218 [Exophiala dermatitidis]KAJ4509551.1 hypothetical protein HRR74_007332 [Exophiala dermatitidis]KAJ4530552.1 hypothetical protein HRR76_008260 [Exophiala dermatitidis]
MAIVPIMLPPEPVQAPPAPSTVEITMQMDNVSIDDAATAQATPQPAVRIAVPLEARKRPAAATSTIHTERKLLRRDSMDRREALLKGKEGSRQRRRWENDRLLSNPWAQPPLPSDWEIKPTYQRRTVPYYLAPLWDAAEFQRAVEAKMKGRKNSTRARGKRTHNMGVSPMEEAASSIPKEVRARLKRAKAAKGLLHDLEETVRAFVQKWNAREARLQEEGLQDVPLTSDSEEEEEIVFVGRNGAMHDSPGRKQQQKEKETDETISTEIMVFEGLDTDKGAAFARWLVHCIGAYYGLRTWSVTRDLGDEGKRRFAYVGVDTRARGFMARGVEFGTREFELPQPLWGMM